MVALDTLLPRLASLSNSWRVRSGAVGTDTVRSEERRGRKHLSEEARGSADVAIDAQREIDRIAAHVGGSVRSAPFTTALDGGLINPDRPALRFAQLPKPLLDRRCIGKVPAVAGGEAHRDITLQKELRDVAVAEPLAPQGGPDDEHRLIVPSSKSSSACRTSITTMADGIIRA